MKYFLVFLFITTSTLVSAQWTLKGQIKDSKTDKPLKNVTITHWHDDESKVKETSKKGKFKLKIKDSLDIIVFSKKGYYEEKMVVNNAKKVKVGLTKKGVLSENEDITDSYGSMKKRKVTGAVTVLKTEDFNKGFSSDIYQLLRGKVPGLVIRHDSQSPNSKPTVMLRGSGTGSRVIEPLIVVDGQSNYSISNVDPNDVKSVQVLRDGSAAAIYGSQAAGGVIIITTKGR